MLWGCIAHNQKGPLIRLDRVPEVMNEKGKKRGGGLDGPKYVKQVLQSPLNDFINELKAERSRDPSSGGWRTFTLQQSRT